MWFDNMDMMLVILLIALGPIEGMWFYSICHFQKLEMILKVNSSVKGMLLLDF